MSYFLEKIFSLLLILGSLTIPIYGSFLHLYTVYLNAIESGFISGLFSFCLPVISEVWYSIDIISTYGFSHYYITLIIIYIAILAITLLSSYALKEGEKN